MISVVVPVYNVEKYIEKCVDSIVNQSYKDFELLLIDDGSKDNSIAIAQDYLSDKDVNYKIYHKENGGLSSARNYGLYKASGDCVVFIDCDDVVSEDFLSRLYESLEDNDFSFCGFQFVKTQDIKVDDNNEIIDFNKEELLESFRKRTIDFVVPSMLFKREFLIDNYISFDETIKFSEDQVFIWQVIFACNKAKYLKRKMYGYYVRENSIMTSSSYDKVISAYNKYCEYTDSFYKKYPQHIDTIKYILPRWKLGTLYTSAHLLNRKDFIHLYKELNGRNILKEMYGFNENKALLLAGVSSLSANLLYYLCRGMNLNG